MISILIIISLSFIPSLIHSAITFVPNPGCDRPQCKDIEQEAFFYANNTIGENTYHMIFSSFDQLTISIFNVSSTSNPTFNYAQLYSKNYTNAIQFDGTKPANSFSFVLRRVIEFNDPDDKGIMPDNLDPNKTKSYFLNELNRSNISLAGTDQPSFQYRIDEVLKSRLIY
jgi:hypothetical protein